MKKLWSYVAFVLAFIAFWLMMACLGVHVAGMKLLYLIRHVPQDRFMIDAACVCNNWAQRSFRVITRIMRIKIVVKHLDPIPIPIPPCLVLSNHVSAMDIVLAPGILVEHGRANTRCAVKEPIRGIPVIGWCVEQIGCPFLSRDRNPHDLEAMYQFGVMVLRQLACILLFPEGTRATELDPSSGYDNVMSPHTGGFRALREAVPELPVLTMAIQYPEAILNGKGRHLTQGARFFGATINVYMSWYSAETVNASPPADWLRETWKKVDQSLSVHA